MRNFNQLLTSSWKTRRSLLCVGLDPDPEKLLPPMGIGEQQARLFDFNRAIIDATAPWACAYKIQFACYAAVGAEAQLEQTIVYIHNRYPEIPVILDAKRGDIGITAKWYAREAFKRYRADAVTVSPYLGGDTLVPFLDYANKGVFILCRTSNPGSGDIQQLESDDLSVARHVATLAAGEWNGNGNVGLVVGATWPEEIGAVRELVGDMPLLIPGIGAQGGSLEDAMRGGLTAGGGLLLSASRSILYAGKGEGDFAEAAGGAAEKLHAEINRLREKLQGESEVSKG